MSSMYRDVIDCIDVRGPGSQPIYSDRNDEAKLTKYARGNFATVVKSQLPPASANAAGSLD
jgi:hypothetical protein